MHVKPIAVKQLLACFCIAVGCIGCVGERESTSNASSVFVNAGAKRLTQTEYHVDPPDEITITAPDVKEINGRVVTVRPSGQITLPLIGDVIVQGKTPSEIVNDLSIGVAKYYKNQPEIRIDVKPESKFIYIFGFGAAKAGKIPYTGNVTVVSALSEAGFIITAWPEQVRLSRPAKNPSQKNATAVIDFTKFWDYGDVTQNYILEEGDVIFIPITPLAEFGEVTRELFEPISNSAGVALTATSFTGK